MAKAKEAVEPVGPRIGARLKAARQSKRLTLDDLAEACGVTKGYLSKLERVSRQRVGGDPDKGVRGARDPRRIPVRECVRR